MLYSITQFSSSKPMPDDLRVSLLQMAGLGGAEHANALTAAQKLGRDYAENLFVTQRKASKRKPSKRAAGGSSAVVRGAAPAAGERAGGLPQPLRGAE